MGKPLLNGRLEIARLLDALAPKPNGFHAALRRL
jgi:hypothetical protein